MTEHTGRQVTVSARTLTLVGVAALALLAAFFIGRVGGGGQAQAAEGDGTRTVTVQGVGHVSVVPDQLVLSLGVEIMRPDLDTALSDANAAMRQVVDALVAQGVAEEDVQTSGLSMYPDYRGKDRTITGYHVSQSVTAVVRDLDQGSDVVSAAVTAGGEGVRIDDMRLQVDDPEASLAPARTDAYEQAKAKAEAYAGDVGASLGEVVKVSEVSEGGGYDERTSYAAADSASGGGVPIEAGQTELSAAVTVVFALE